MPPVKTQITPFTLCFSVCKMLSSINLQQIKMKHHYKHYLSGVIVLLATLQSPEVQFCVSLLSFSLFLIQGLHRQQRVNSCASELTAVAAQKGRDKRGFKHLPLPSSQRQGSQGELCARKVPRQLQGHGLKNGKGQSLNRAEAPNRFILKKTLTTNISDFGQLSAF